MILTGFFTLCAFDIEDRPEKKVNPFGTRATVIVGPGQTYTSIQDGIDAVGAGGSVRVYAGWYNEDVYLNDTVEIIGNGTTNTVFDSTGAPHNFYQVLSIQ